MEMGCLLRIVDEYQEGGAEAGVEADNGQGGKGGEEAEWKYDLPSGHAPEAAKFHDVGGR